MHLRNSTCLRWRAGVRSALAALPRLRVRRPDACSIEPCTFGMESIITSFIALLIETQTFIRRHALVLPLGSATSLEARRGIYARTDGGTLEHLQLSKSPQVSLRRVKSSVPVQPPSHLGLSSAPCTLDVEMAFPRAAHATGSRKSSSWRTCMKRDRNQTFRVLDVVPEVQK